MLIYLSSSIFYLLYQAIIIEAISIETTKRLKYFTLQVINLQFINVLLFKLN